MMSAALKHAEALIQLAHPQEQKAIFEWLDKDPAAFVEAVKEAAHVLAMAKCMKISADDQDFNDQASNLVHLSFQHREAWPLLRALVRADRAHPEKDHFADPDLAEVTAGRIDRIMAILVK